MEDFNWLRSQQSPNWSLLPPEERAGPVSSRSLLFRILSTGAYGPFSTLFSMLLAAAAEFPSILTRVAAPYTGRWYSPPPCRAERVQCKPAPALEPSRLAYQDRILQEHPCTYRSQASGRRKMLPRSSWRMFMAAINAAVALCCWRAVVIQALGPCRSHTALDLTPYPCLGLLP